MMLCSMTLQEASEPALVTPSEASAATEAPADGAADASPEITDSPSSAAESLPSAAESPSSAADSPASAADEVKQPAAVKAEEEEAPFAEPEVAAPAEDLSGVHPWGSTLPLLNFIEGEAPCCV